MVSGWDRRPPEQEPRRSTPWQRLLFTAVALALVALTIGWTIF